VGTRFTASPDRIRKATNTYSRYVILIPFPQQQWLHERASVLHSTCIVCLVTLLSPVSSFKRRKLMFL